MAISSNSIDFNLMNLSEDPAELMLPMDQLHYVGTGQVLNYEFISPVMDSFSSWKFKGFPKYVNVMIVPINELEAFATVTLHEEIIPEIPAENTRFIEYFLKEVESRSELILLENRGAETSGFIARFPGFTIGDILQKVHNTVTLIERSVINKLKR